MVKSKFFILLSLCFIFLINFSSAAEFDNVANYNEELKVVTVTNAFGMGEVIGQAILNTELNVMVSRGYQKVAEFDIWTYDDYNDAIKQFIFKDMKNGKTKINREYDLKMLTLEDVKINTYSINLDNCWIDIIGDTECERIINGSKIITEEVWTKITPADLKKSEMVTIGVFTDVQKGDYIDWIPVIYGVEVPEWATWTESLNVNLSLYYKMENTSIIDSHGTYDGTNSGVDFSLDGIILKGGDFESGDSDYFTSVDSDLLFDENAGAISLWVKPETLDTSQRFLFQTDGAGGDDVYCLYTTALKLYCKIGAGYSSADILTTGNWQHVVLTWDSTSAYTYINGNFSAKGSNSHGGSDMPNLEFGRAGTDDRFWDGMEDEIAVYSRNLSSSEISDLYNGDIGITYTSGSSPTVTLTSPVDNFNSTVSNVDLVASITDSQYVENVTLYLDGVLNETNSSHFNGTYTFNKDLSFGSHNWSILAWNNQSISNQSETRFINYTDETPSIVLTSPTDDANLTSSSVSFIGTATDNIGVANVTLYIDGVLNQTNTSGFNGTYQFDKTIAEGVHNWSMLVYDSVGLSNQSATRDINYTEPLIAAPTITLIYPDNNTINTTSDWIFVFNATDEIGIASTSLIIDDIYVENDTSGVNGTYLFDIEGIADGDHYWQGEAENDDELTTTSEKRYFTVDTTDPIVNIIYPTTTTYTFNISTLNYSISDSNPDKCWYSIDSGTTNSTAISPANFTNVMSTEGTNTWTVYCNDTVGHEGSDFVTFERDTLVTILNSPADDSSVVIGNTIFNATGNSTIGNTLQNMSLWTNSSGSWDISNTTDIFPTNYIYSGDFFSAAQKPNPVGITWDGTYFWVVYSGEDDVYKYNSTGSPLSSFSIAGEDSSPTGIIWDGSNLWVLGHDTDTAYEYTTAGSYTSNSFSTSTDALGGTFNGTNFFIVDDSGNTVYEYTSMGVSSGSYTGINDPRGITWDGTYFWILDGSDDVNRYTSLFSLTGVSFSVTSEDGGMQELTMKDTNIWAIGAANDKAYKYDLDYLSDSTQIFTKYVNDTLLWNVETCLTDGMCNFAPSNFTLGVDTIPPVVTIAAPVGTLGAGVVGNPETLNFTSTDANLQSCWYEYNGTNTTIEGCISGVSNETTFILADTTNTITVWANDSSGLLTSDTSTWDYLINDISIAYDTPVGAGIPNTIVQVISIGGGGLLEDAYLDYNGTNYSTSLNFTGGNYILTTTAPAPDVTSEENVSFRFVVEIDSVFYNLRENLQLITPLNFSICTGGDVLLDISLYDEETLSSLNGDIEINLDLKSTTSLLTVKTLNFTVENDSDILLCLDPIDSTEFFILDAEIRYEAEGYEAELYHLQDADLTSVPINLDLYDLNSNDSTIFDIIYQDDTFNFIEGAIIQLQRKYISEGVFRTVEAPLTSDDGKAIVHIDLDSIKYRATIVKDGVVLDEFENIVFNCQSELTGECSHQLLGEIDPGNDIDYDVTRDFIYDITETNESIQVSFSVPSGTPSSVNIKLVQKDQFGNTQVCNTTILSSAGSTECSFNTTIGDSYIDFSISKNGVPLALQTYIVPEESGLDWLGNNYIFIIIILFSLVGMSLSSPEWIIINGVLTMVISGGMWLANGLDFVMGLGNLVWLVVAAIILIAKQAKQEDR